MKHLKVLIFIAVVYAGGYIHIGAVGLFGMTFPIGTIEFEGAPVLVLWHEAVRWVIPFLTAGIVIGLLVGWVPRRGGWFWSAVVSCLALLVLILTRRYIIFPTVSLSANGTVIGRGGFSHVLCRYLANLLSAGAGGLLGGLMIQAVRRKIRKRIG